MDHSAVERVSNHSVHLVGQTEAEFTEVMTLLIELHEEGGYAPLDLEMAAKDVYQVLGEGMTWCAKDGEGEPIGVLGLIETPFWYSGLTFLLSKWFYVRPAHRFGKVGVALLHAARDEAEKQGKLAFVMTTNPTRRAKGGSWLTVAGEQAGYISAGYMLRLGGRHGQRKQHQIEHEIHLEATG